MRVFGMLLGSAVALSAVNADAAERAGAADKSQYTLFNPTPDRLLRDLATDRPDTTESPFTVDAGRVQVETTLVGYMRSRPEADGTVTRSTEFATTNIRVGITSNTELNLILQPYGVVRASDPTATRDSGIGGAELRAKFNLWGNDSFDRPGATSLAILPYVSLPTSRTNGVSPADVEGGLILPFAIQLSEKFGLGLNTAFDVVHNDGTSGYHVEYVNTASLSYSWDERLGTYYEVVTRLNTGDPRGDIVVLATGATYKLKDNLQIDAGINVGVTDAADRFNPFVGVSRRF